MQDKFLKSQRFRFGLAGALGGLTAPVLFAFIDRLIYHPDFSLGQYLSFLAASPEDLLVHLYISGSVVVLGGAGYFVGKMRERDLDHKAEIEAKNAELQGHQKELRDLNENLERKISEGREELVESAAKLREMNNKLVRQIEIQRRIAGNVPSLLALVDPSMTYVEMNEYGSRQFLEKPISEILGRKCWEVAGNSGVCIEECAVKKAFETGRESIHTRAATIRGKDVILENKSIPLKDSAGKVTHVLKIVNDATARKKEEDDLKRRANYDALTGVYNKHYMDLYLKNEEHKNKTDKRKRGPYTIIYADLDNLKDANDTYGHEAGDILLKKIAQVFQDNTRHEDIIARVGGDEFVIILPHSGPEEGEVLISRFKRQCDDWNRAKKPTERLSGLSLGVSYGLGTSVYGTDLYDTIHKADSTMYRAKKGKKVTNGDGEQGKG